MTSASYDRDDQPVAECQPKEKQGLRLAFIAPVLMPVSLLPKPGFGNLISKR